MKTQQELVTDEKRTIRDLGEEDTVDTSIVPAVGEWKHVVKWYYPLRDRVTETKIIDDARGVLEEVDIKGAPVKLVDCLPRYYFTGDVKDKDRRLEAFIGVEEKRISRIIVFERLDPVYTLTDTEEFKEAIRQIALGA